jgi:phage terminase large subunit-like protein
LEAEGRVSQRKTAEEIKLAGNAGHLTQAELAQRGVLKFEFGEPPKEVGLNRHTLPEWRDLVTRLLARRVLAKTDGPILLQYIRAKKAKDTAKCSEIATMFAARTPFDVPEPPPPPPREELLHVHVATVAEERTSFPARLVPGRTVCSDTGAEYSWPEGEAATIARDYANAVITGTVVAGKLVIRAGMRFLQDLESGAARGLFFDTVAARNAVFFFEKFCGPPGFKLEPWETFILAQIFGWKTAAGLRRFREGFLSVGRKNGKTFIAAGIGLYCLVCDQEPRAEIFIAATAIKQANLMFQAASYMRAKNEQLNGYIGELRSVMTVADTFSSFRPLASDAKTLDGLNASCNLVDELHEHSNRNLWDKLVGATVARSQPFTLATTTAGDNMECFAHTKHELAEKMLNGVLENDSLFAYVACLDPEDDPLDEKNWPKANPNLGVSVRVENLRQLADGVKQNPADLNSFIRYHTNQWLALRVGRSIPADLWEACRGMEMCPDLDPKQLRAKFMELNKKQPCFAALDMGGNDDLSAFCLLYRNAVVPDSSFLVETVVAVPFFWIPEQGLMVKEKRWGVPLSQWVREGWLRVTPGDYSDPKAIKADIIHIATKEAYVTELGFDKWNAQILCGELHAEGVVPCTRVPQTYEHLTAPCEEFKRAALSGKGFWHLGNPVLRWMVGNLVLEPAKSGGLMPEKLSQREKIDGIQAIITAWNRLINAPALMSWNGIVKTF